MKIIGQTNIIDFIDKSKIDTFPRTFMLYGDKGSGRHSIFSYISEKLQLPTLDLSSKLTPELIDEMYSKVQPYLYLIDLQNMSQKDQISILKFIEEPLKNSFICIIATSHDNVLNTITNRCQVFYLNTYTKDILQQFITNKTQADLILRVATTPGQVKIADELDLNETYELCKKLVTKLGKASVTNTLSISEKLGYKGEKDKLDVDIFIRMLLSVTVDIIVDFHDVLYYNMFKLVRDTYDKLLVKNVNKKYIVENFLIKAWDLYHEGV